MYMPWREVGDWQVPGDAGAHQKAFERLLIARPNFLNTVCFPKMKLGIEVARDLARLQTMLVGKFGTAEGNDAQQQLEGHLRISETLRQLRDPDDDGTCDAREAERGAEGLHASHAELVEELPGGREAAEQLGREGHTTKAGQLYRWLVTAVLAGERPKVFVHGAGGCGKSHFIRAVVSALRAADVPVAIAAPTGCA
eukprot:16449004-Heterocapsa_arctica.AAC.1